MRIRREPEFIKKMRSAIDEIVDDIPPYEDAVVEVFLGHRDRKGKITVKKYVFSSIALNNYANASFSLSTQSGDISYGLVNNMRMDEYNQVLEKFQDYVEEAFVVSDEISK